MGSDNGYSPGMLCGQNLASSLRLFKAYHQVPRSRAGDDMFVGFIVNFISFGSASQIKCNVINLCIKEDPLPNSNK